MSILIEKSKFARGLQEVRRLTGQHHLVVTLEAACYIYADKEVPESVPVDIVVPNRCSLFEDKKETKQGNLYGKKLEMTLCGLPFVIWYGLLFNDHGEALPLKSPCSRRFAGQQVSSLGMMRLTRISLLSRVYQDRSLKNHLENSEMLKKASDFMAYRIASQLSPTYWEEQLSPFHS